MFRRVLLLAAVVGSTGCAGEFASHTSSESVEFFYSSSSVDVHIWIAILLLVLGLFLPLLLKKRKDRSQGLFYTMVLVLYLAISFMNLYGYWVKREFRLVIRPEIIVVDDISGRAEISWDSLFEVERADRIHVPGLNKVPRLEQMNKCFKFIGRNKVMKVVPDSFSAKDRELFLKLLLGRDVIVSEEAFID